MWAPPGSSLSLAVVITCCIMMGQHSSVASQMNTICQVDEGKADCSHLKLSAVPSDLPRNITSLDMSHNRLSKIPPETLTPYEGLLHLDVGYNSITKLEAGLCQALPLLLALNVEHNELHVLKKEDLSHCSSLTRLNIGNNRLKLGGEPFFGLQSLEYLDVSANKLQSAELGSVPQLPNLLSLNLAFNDITTLKTSDFVYLKNSTFPKLVNLSSVSLKKLEPGCFKPLTGLHTLIMDGSNMGTSVIAKLCTELSETAITVLSLRRMKLVTLTSTTFKGLQNTNLTFLDLSNNAMGKIEGGSFQWLPWLQTLILVENNIKHLMKGTFLGLKSLKRLQLTKALMKSRSSPIPIIDESSFLPLSNLESLILNHTAIRDITENTFTGLTSLKELDLSWCRCESLRSIDSKTFASLAGSPLRKLNLTATSMAHIKPGSFSMLGNLTILLLDFNYISQTLTGEEFEGLDQVQEIHMYNNHQRVVLTATSFIHVPNLRILTLGKSLNPTTLNLDPSPFNHLINLTVLDLSNNNVANIGESAFEGLVNLKVLKLEHNNFARLWKSVNPGGPALFLKGLRSLTTLLLDNNGLDEIPANALRGLSNLRELSLGYNLLNQLKDSIFDDLSSLRILHLQKNSITAVRPQVFQNPLSNISELNIEKNPFDCTCESILWFANWLNNTNSSKVLGPKDMYMCNTPLAYFNHSVMDFDVLPCKDMTPFQDLFIVSSTAVLMLIVTSLLVRFQGWRIQFYWNIMINRTLGFSDASVEEGREFEYDAYVIHSEEDQDWVERRMIPLENDNCMFCLQYRDSVPGVSQLESILDNMRNSRKILFVVTESLLNDPWCRRFIAQQALHQVIEDSRDSVVLVFLQDVHDYKLSRSLFLRRGMLRPCCILDWPVQKERIPAFHQKLLIALGMTNRLRE